MLLSILYSLFTEVVFSYRFYYSPGVTRNENGRSDPEFMKKYGEAALQNDSGSWIDKHVWHGKAHTWEKVRWMVAQWRRISNGRPFVVKGIQRTEDALKAPEIGCEGIVVTNHAGRQVDGAVGSLEMLPEIAEAVGDSELLLLPVIVSVIYNEFQK